VEVIMKTLSHIILGIALAAPLSVGSVVHADDKSTPAEHKENTTMDKLPKSVRATVERECKGKNIESMTKSVDKNGVIIAYEVTYADGSNETTMDIAKNGKVLMRRPTVAESAPTDQSNHMHDDMKGQTRPNDTKPDSSH
jgi:hypothetical protein